MKRVVVVIAALLGACAGPPGQDGRPGIIGPMGDKGDVGPGAPPGIIAITPLAVAQGVKAQVQISGTGTSWNDTASVSFGSDITVARVKAASANALVVDIEVSPTATMGTRDITVSSGSSSLSFRSAFQVVPLVTVAATGKAMRGGLVSIVVSLNDPQVEFDTSWSGTAFTGISATTSPAGVVAVRDVKPHSVTLLAGLDIDAPLGMRELRLTNAWRRPSEQTFTFPALFDVADVTEQVLAATPLTGTLAQPFDSAVYKWTPTTTYVEQLASVTTTNGKGAPMLVAVPVGGRYTAGALVFTNSFLFTPYTIADYRFVVVDSSGASGVDYSVSVITPNKVTETEPDESISMPMAAAVPQWITATLSSAMDVDVYKVTVTQAEVGRALRIRTRASSLGGYNTDVRIELVRPDGSAVMSPVDITYQEDARSPALTQPGDYYVRISWGRFSTIAWSVYNSYYDMLLNWE